MLHERVSVVAGIVLFGGSALGQGVPTAYTLVELQPLGGGANSRVAAINDRGVIVGRTQFGTGPVATQWGETGVAGLVTITSGGQATEALAVNDEGSMLVECTGCSGRPAVRLADGTILNLEDPTAIGLAGVAEHITSSGDVGGLFRVDVGGDSFDVYSIIWELSVGPAMNPTVRGPFITNIDLSIFGIDNGILSDTGDQVYGSGSGTGGAELFLYETRTEETSTVFPSLTDFVGPEDINASRQYITLEGDGGGSEVWLRTVDGGANLLFPIGCSDSQFGATCYSVVSDPMLGTALNDHGIVVGNSYVFVDDGTGFPLDTGKSAFVWSEESDALDLAELVTDGTASGWDLVVNNQFFSTGPVDINNQGWIVGNGINPMGQPAGYLLIPRDPCRADANRDGQVTPTDFTAWISAFNNGCD